MSKLYLVLSLAAGLASLAFAVGTGAVLWWLLYFRGSLVAALLLTVGLAIVLLALAIARHRDSMVWTVFYLFAFSLLFVSAWSPLGLGPFLGPPALLFLALASWRLFDPVRR